MEKVCRRCGSSDWSHKGKCQVCSRARNRTWYAANKKKANPNRPWACIRCGGARRNKVGDCADCLYTPKVAWNAKHPERIAAHQRKTSYDISAAEYKALFTAQGGRCAICRQPETAVSKKAGRVKALAVDHCHKSKKIRGLLCQACNVGLGYFRDSPLLLAAAFAYLEAANMASEEG